MRIIEIWDKFTPEEIKLMHMAWESSEGKTELCLLPFKPISTGTMAGVVSGYVKEISTPTRLTDRWFVEGVDIDELYAKLRFPSLRFQHNANPS